MHKHQEGKIPRILNKYVYLGVNKLTKTIFPPLPTFDSNFLSHFHVLLLKKWKLGNTHSENGEGNKGR